MHVWKCRPDASHLCNGLHLTDSIIGLIFLNAAFNQAFTTWLLRGTFLGIPAEMEQAAKIDGCNKLQAMFRVLLPRYRHHFDLYFHRRPE